MNFIKRHLSEVLWAIIAVGVLALVMLFVDFNTKVAANIQETKKLAMQTSGVVQGQTQILAAIQQVTKDTNLTAQQQTDIIICMLQVPVEQRTTDLQAQCKKQATPVALSSTSENSAGSNTQASSSQSTAPASQQQSDTSQKKPNVVMRFINRVVNDVKGIL